MNADPFDVEAQKRIEEAIQQIWHGSLNTYLTTLSSYIPNTLFPICRLQVLQADSIVISSMYSCRIVVDCAI